jgi:hypothetical protein
MELLPIAIAAGCYVCRAPNACDSQPASSNTLRAQYPPTCPGLSASFSLTAPEAGKVAVFAPRLFRD